MNPATSAVAGFVVGHFGGVLMGLQILPKEPQYPVEQMFAGGVAGDAVVLAGVDLHIEINSCVDKGIDVGGGVAEEDVVIIQAVNYEQFAV